MTNPPGLRDSICQARSFRWYGSAGKGLPNCPTGDLEAGPLPPMATAKLPKDNSIVSHSAPATPMGELHRGLRCGAASEPGGPTSLSDEERPHPQPTPVCAFEGSVSAPSTPSSRDSAIFVAAGPLVTMSNSSSDSPSRAPGKRQGPEGAASPVRSQHSAAGKTGTAPSPDSPEGLQELMTAAPRPVKTQLPHRNYRQHSAGGTPASAYSRCAGRLSEGTPHSARSRSVPHTASRHMASSAAGHPRNMAMGMGPQHMVPVPMYQMPHMMPNSIPPGTPLVQGLVVPNMFSPSGFVMYDPYTGMVPVYPGQMSPMARAYDPAALHTGMQFGPHSAPPEGAPLHMGPMQQPMPPPYLPSSPEFHAFYATPQGRQRLEGGLPRPMAAAPKAPASPARPSPPAALGPLPVRLRPNAPRGGANGGMAPPPPRGGPAARALRLPQEPGLGLEASRLAVRPAPVPALAASPLLEEFKASRGQQRLELKELQGHVYEFCRDQHGSRLIQLKLETASPAEVEAVFEEVRPVLGQLMCDVFGNYVVQKFLEHGTSAQQARLAAALRHSVRALSIHMYGCRVVQKALEALDLEAKQAIVRELEGWVVHCVYDQNGNHVIQKCLEFVKPSHHIRFLLEELLGSPGHEARRLGPGRVPEAGAVPLARHGYGCRVIQRVLEHCTLPRVRQQFLAEVLAATQELACDTYGNYVIQHVLEHGTDEQRGRVVECLQGQIVPMSLHKFASNVVEKALTHGTPHQRTALVAEMLRPAPPPPPARAGCREPGAGAEAARPLPQPLHELMKDQYGNYVVQKTLEVCGEEQRAALLAALRAHLATLRKQTYGKHICARLEKVLQADQDRIPPPLPLPEGGDGGATIAGAALPAARAPAAPGGNVPLSMHSAPHQSDA